MSWNGNSRQSETHATRSASSWGCELKYGSIRTGKSKKTSASSWGCELKYHNGTFTHTGIVVSLFVRLWVEISRAIFHVKHSGRQPLREAVSWNACYHEPQYEQTVSLFVRLWVEMNQSRKNYQTETTSASSWGCELKYGHCYGRRRNTSQPLREAVSWNINSRPRDTRYFSQPLREAVSWNTNALRPLRKMLRQPLREAVSWNVYDTLLGEGKIRQPLREAVSWNFCKSCFHGSPSCQPLREAVSWNVLLILNWYDLPSQPLREAVSWNEYESKTRTDSEQSASSWGCELKYDDKNVTCRDFGQPLREAVSWNI